MDVIWEGDSRSYLLLEALTAISSSAFYGSRGAIRSPRMPSCWSLELRYYTEASHVGSVLGKMPIYPCLLVFEALRMVTFISKESEELL